MVIRNKTVPLFIHLITASDSLVFFQTIFQVFSHYPYGLIRGKTTVAITISPLSNPNIKIGYF